MSEEDPDLDAAYALKTPEDSKRLYADWATTYDSGFAQDMSYRLPRMVALVLAEVFQGPGPVLDVGAGTGLVAEAMKLREAPDVDALDISPEMLKVAEGKGLYRNYIVGDLTDRLDLADGTYGAVVSAGTFTHGHVGPEALVELLRVARRGAVFVLSVNAAHFETLGFAATFEALGDRIEGLEMRAVDIYGPGADPAHADDQAQIVIFRKL
ncbi:MAG: class I SAM-dependent methyltransferase [Sulfitobacter sp.]|nr:class I SAM-dependent methyltransferase [Sulfitobacter sp.]